MSGMRHPTISAWQRQEDGSYAAEIDGWSLHVKWHPESADAHRGFSWKASQPGQAVRKLASTEISEEIEIAMAHAEAAVEEAQKAQNALAPHVAALLAGSVGDGHGPGDAPEGHDHAGGAHH